MHCSTAALGIAVIFALAFVDTLQLVLDTNLGTKAAAILCKAANKNANGEYEVLASVPVTSQTDTTFDVLFTLDCVSSWQSVETCTLSKQVTGKEIKLTYRMSQVKFTPERSLLKKFFADRYTFDCLTYSGAVFAKSVT